MTNAIFKGFLLLFGIFLFVWLVFHYYFFILKLEGEAGRKNNLIN